MSERILIIKIAALGDAIMASALIPAIRREWPAATIGWLAGRSIAPVVSLFSGIDELITVDDRALLRGSRLQQLAQIARTWRAVGRRWDRVIVAHTDRRYAVLGAAAGADSTVRFADALAPRKGHWHGAEYARLATGSEGDLARTARYTTFETDRLPAPPAVSGEGPLVVVVPGGARNVLRDDQLRRWPIESWTVATAELVRRGYRVVALGAPDDHEECRRVEQAGAQNLCGRTNLPELTSLLNTADVVVTHDSGPLHLSLILKRPVVVLLGPTSPNYLLPPNSGAVVLSRAHTLACAPCYDGKNYADCALNLCLTLVPAMEVADAVSHLIESASHMQSQTSAP